MGQFSVQIPDEGPYGITGEFLIGGVSDGAVVQRYVSFSSIVPAPGARRPVPWACSGWPGSRPRAGAAESVVPAASRRRATPYPIRGWNRKAAS
jgi:hypothetical protein